MMKRSGPITFEEVVAKCKITNTFTQISIGDNFFTALFQVWLPESRCKLESSWRSLPSSKPKPI